MASGAFVLALLSAVPASSSHVRLEVISVAPDGTRAQGYSWWPSMTPDGRYVSFESTAHNIVPHDLNHRWDIFVRDRWTGTTDLATVGWDDAPANGDSHYASISADGRFVAFTSDARNLIPWDSGASDIFVRDLEAKTTQLVTRAFDGNDRLAHGEYPRISADGRTVVFYSSSGSLVPGKNNLCTNQFGETHRCSDIFAHDVESGTTSIVSVASDGALSNGNSFFSWVSGDGRYVAFSSRASNLVPNDNNNREDVFVHDRLTGETELISAGISGTGAAGTSERPFISANGRYIAYYSGAPDVGTPGVLTGGVIVFDRETGTTVRASTGPGGVLGSTLYGPDPPAITDDGRWVAFRRGGSRNDPDRIPQLYLRDLVTGGIWRMSATEYGEPGVTSSWAPSISADGRLIAFFTGAWNLTGEREGLRIEHVIVRDRGEATCPDGIRQEGRYSSRLAHETAPEPLDPTRHDLSCALAREGL